VNAQVKGLHCRRIHHSDKSQLTQPIGSAGIAVWESGESAVSDSELTTNSDDNGDGSYCLRHIARTTVMSRVMGYT